MIVPELSEVSPRALSRNPAPVLTRDNFRFSPGGATAACVASDGQGGLHLEVWSFAGPSPRWEPLPLTTAVTPRMQPIPLDDGRVLLWREGVRDAGVYEIVLLDVDGDRPEQVLGTIAGDGLLALRLLPCPMREPGEEPSRQLAVAVSFDARGSTVWRLAAEPPHLQRLAEVPGTLLGGAWLDRTGRYLGVDRKEGNGPIKGVAVDLLDGSWTPLLAVTEASNDRLLACDPRSGLLMVSTDAPGEERLGWGRLGGPAPVRFPETLHRPGHAAAYPVTFDPEGQRVLLYSDEGARVGLTVYTPGTDRLAPVEIPAGVVHSAPCWAGGVLHFLFSTPCQPPGVATVKMPDASGWSVAGSAPAPAGRRWADAHVESLDGAAGPIEAIVYGGEGWRTSRRLLVALHGGPVDAWRFTFEPLFQRLAAAGIAIVAPNQRGSSRYGAAHMHAIRGAWGGEDLDDVCHIARALDARRRASGAPALMLLGVSYGAFLALLATSREPDLWSRCVALAPFLSVSRLYQEASPGVRILIEGSGGLPELHDETGPRDVLALCAAIRAKLLIVHGERDELIPVSQPRALRQRLLALGRHEGVDFEYLEIPGSGHDLILRAYTQLLHERLMRFLADGSLNHVRPADRPQNP